MNTPCWRCGGSGKRPVYKPGGIKARTLKTCETCDGGGWQREVQFNVTSIVGHNAEGRKVNLAFGSYDK
jgi:DnaJ-class molecular chaperone